MKVGKPTQRSIWRKLGFAAVGLVIVAGPQLAALGALSRFLARSAPSLASYLPLFTAVVVLLNVALALEYARTFRDREVPRLYRYLLFYPYYTWWFGSTVFAVVGGFAQLVSLPFVLSGAMRPLGGPIEAALAIFAYALGAYGVAAGQAGLRPEQLDVPLPGLPRGWQGARIVQISDIHAGRYNGDNRVRTLAEAGVKLLRNEGMVVERNGDGIWLAGVDEAWFHRTDLREALRQRPEGMTTVLLSHHPELFPDAADADVDLQLSGHTHGGQIGLLRLHPSLSLYRLISPFVAGFYRLGDALLYVNRGAGTVQPLIRIGAPPEVTTLTLREGQASEAEALDYRRRSMVDEEVPSAA